MSSGAVSADVEAPGALLEAAERAGLDVDREGPVIHSADLGRELRAARRAAALCWSPDRAGLSVQGADRLGFLHRMLTQEIDDLAPGECRRALLLDQKGRIVADLDLGGAADRVLGITDAGVVERVIGDLQRFVLRADVEFASLASDHVVLRLVGPAAVEVLQAAGAGAPPDPGLAAVRLADVEAWALRTPRALPGFDLVVPREGAGPVWSRLIAAGEAEGIVALGSEAAELLRIEAGIPAHGAELTAGEFPQEARLEAAVNFEKGCYLGQETVARIHYRGHVNRRLAGLVSGAPLVPGTDLLAGGRSVGAVTSAARMPSGEWLALAYVRVEHTAPGSELHAASSDGGEAATVRIRDVARWGRSQERAADPIAES